MTTTLTEPPSTPPAAPPATATASVHPPHPLLSKPLTRVRTWQEFQRVWEETNNADHLIGMLNCLNGIQPVEEFPHYTERTLFLLRLADGWSHTLPQTGTHEGENFDRTMAARHVSQRAFQVLCDTLLCKGRKDDRYGLPEWAPRILPQATLEVAVWFMRMGVGGKFRNSTKNGFYDAHREEIFVKFMRDFCYMAWHNDKEMTRYPYQNDPSLVWDRLVAIRPQLFPIMENLKMLHLFIDGGYTADDAFIKVWKSAVLSRPALFPGSNGQRRLPIDCMEACSTGYTASTLLGVMVIKSHADKLSQSEFARLLMPDLNSAPQEVAQDATQ